MILVPVVTLESNYGILLHASLSQLSNGRKARLRATSGVSFRFREQLCQVTSLVQRDEAPVKACVAAPSQVFMALDQFKMVFLSIRLDGEIHKIYKLANLRSCQNPSWTFYSVLRLAQKPQLAQRPYQIDRRKYLETGCPKVPSTLAHKRMYLNTIQIIGFVGKGPERHIQIWMS